jgi:hypothetical protein
MVGTDAEAQQMRRDDADKADDARRRGAPLREVFDCLPPGAALAAPGARFAAS